MIVTCPNCTMRLQLDKAKVPARAFSVRCPKCQQIINAQPPAAQSQRDALAAVGDLPASSRSQQGAGPAPAVPLSEGDDAAGPHPTPLHAPSPTDEVLRLLASLLRREAVEASDVKGPARRAWGRRRVLVCVGSAYGGAVARVLEDAGHDVFVADDTTQAMERMRDAHVDVLVLDPEFDMPRRGANFVSREMGAMRMPERRRVVFVQLSDKARTCDAHAAFLAGANLVVNTAEVEELPRALEKNIRDLNELYRDFNKALSLAEL